MKDFYQKGFWPSMAFSTLTYDVRKNGKIKEEQ